MPTVMTHAVAGVAIAQALAPCSLRRRLSWVAAVSAMLPDADVIGFGFGLNYGDFFGHRGFTHSILFAALVAGTALAAIRPDGSARARARILLCLLLAAGSHGVLDALTNGGLGVAFFAPFDPSRYFFPARPILVSPIGLSFFSERGARVFANECMWLWIPAALTTLAARWLRCRPAGTD
jgi:inner membrane protein